jgi:hypothetical protein
VRCHVAERARWEIPPRAIRSASEESRERKEMRSGTGQGKEMEHAWQKRKGAAMREGAQKREKEDDHRGDIGRDKSEVKLHG